MGDKAFIFRGVPASRANLKRALLLSADAYEERWGDECRCPFVPCFQELTTVHKGGYVHFWRHKRPPCTGYCPHYVPGDGDGDTDWRPHRAALADVHSALHQSLVERHMWLETRHRQLETRHRQLADDMIDRHTKIKISLGEAGGEPAILIDNWGVVWPIHRGNVESRSHSDLLGDRRAIPIVAEEDLEELNRSSLRSHLQRIVERQPVPVIRPKPEGAAGPWSLITSPDQTDPNKIMPLPRSAIPISVDARALFGTPAPDAEWPWPPAGLLPIWVWSEPESEETYEEALNAVKASLEQRHPLGIKVIRLLAKRLLVDGGSLHRILFDQKREEAQRFFLEAKRTFPREKDILRPHEFPRMAEGAEPPTDLERIGRVQTYLEAIRTEGAQVEHRERERARKMAAELVEMKQKTQILGAGLRKLTGKLETTAQELRGAIEDQDKKLKGAIEATKELEGKIATLRRDVQTRMKKLDGRLETTTQELWEGIENQGKKLEGKIRVTTKGLQDEFATGLRRMRSELETELEKERRERFQQDRELVDELQKVSHVLRWIVAALVVIGLAVLFLLGARWFGQAGESEAEGDSNVASVALPSDAETASGPASGSTQRQASGPSSGQGESRTSGQADKSASEEVAPRALPGDGSSIESAQDQRPSVGILGSDDPPRLGKLGGVQNDAAGAQPAPGTGETKDEETTGPQEAPTVPKPGPEPPTKPPITEPPPSPRSSSGTLRINFESVGRKGHLAVYLRGKLILNRSFRPGSVTAEHSLPAGALELRVVVTPKGRQAQIRELTGQITGGSEVTLEIRLDKSRNLTANLG